MAPEEIYVDLATAQSLDVKPCLLEFETYIHKSKVDDLQSLLKDKENHIRIGNNIISVLSKSSNNFEIENNQLKAALESMDAEREKAQVEVFYLGEECAKLKASLERDDDDHPDSVYVQKFANAMKSKMAQSRDKGGYEWETSSIEHLSKLLMDHVEKGDPIDIANFCMMLWSRGSVVLGGEKK